jgi:hypothetical protein
MQFRSSYLTDWKPWFAWLPVRVYFMLPEGCEWRWVWLETVRRRRTGLIWEFTK